MSTLRWIATNEGNIGARKLLQFKLLKLGWEIRNLDLEMPGCDAVFRTEKYHHTVGVQIKTILDFITSWWSGRVQRQLRDMQSIVDIPVLLLEGYAHLDTKTNGILSTYGVVVDQHNKEIPYSTLTHALLDLTLNLPQDMRCGITISPTPDFTVQWLHKYGPAYLDKEEFTGWQRIENPPYNKDIALQMVLSWLGVSEGRGRLMLEKYRTPFDLLDAIRSGQDIGIKGISTGILGNILRQGNSQYRG